MNNNKKLFTVVHKGPYDRYVSVNPVKRLESAEVLFDHFRSKGHRVKIFFTLLDQKILMKDSIEEG